VQNLNVEVQIEKEIPQVNILICSIKKDKHKEKEMLMNKEEEIEVP
jgi:hypothetical protein